MVKFLGQQWSDILFFVITSKFQQSENLFYKYVSSDFLWRQAFFHIIRNNLFLIFIKYIRDCLFWYFPNNCLVIQWVHFEYAIFILLCLWQSSNNNFHKIYIALRINRNISNYYFWCYWLTWYFKLYKILKGKERNVFSLINACV